MPETPLYLLDSDVLMTAKNSYYAFDICPGFWASLLHFHREQQLASIDKVRSELLVGRKEEDLVQWVRNEVPTDFFRSSDSVEVTSAYKDVMLWVQRHTRYLDAAKAKFATGADGWLVAYAKANGSRVITLEQPAPESKINIKLPDVCAQFEVKYDNTFVMLKNLGAKYDWKVVA